MTDGIGIDPAALRGALGGFATGVAIVTAADGRGGHVGMTINSFTSVSLDPPLVLWCIDGSARSLPAFLAAGYYAVNVLAADQQSLSVRFARRGEDKFSGLEVTEGIGGSALFPGCVARLQCRIVGTYEEGDHVILLGQVLACDREDRPPLVFFGGTYGGFRPFG